MAGAQPCREVIGYFPSWKWYDRGKLVRPATIDYTKYTILNYAFFRPNNDGTVVPFDPTSDKPLLLGELASDAPADYIRRAGFGNPNWHIPGTSLVDKAHEKNCKVVISIGGWTMSEPFPGIAASAEKRRRFAHSCNQMIRVYGIDGIDLDWEYPGFRAQGGTAADKRNFTLLLEEIRDSLDALEAKTYQHYLLTSAFGVAPTRMSEIEWGKVMHLLDYVNLMTYDFYGSGPSSTNHNSPLFAPAKGLKGYDIHSVVHHLIENYNVPPGKINIGLAFYGRSIKTQGAPGLHVAARRGADHVTFGEDGGAPSFYNIIPKQSLFNYYWDSLAQVPYLKGKSTNTFVTYEDENSIACKANYILDHNLAGAIIWEITGDYVEAWPGGSVRTPLADALKVALCEEWKLGGQESFASLAVIGGVSKLPVKMVEVSRKSFYQPRIATPGPPLTKKEKRKLKKLLKKQRKNKTSVRYFDGGW